MRIALVTLFYTLGLVIFGGGGVWADGKADVENELKKFQGTWTIEAVEGGGKKLPVEPPKGRTITFEGDKYFIKRGDAVEEAATFQLDPSKSPKTLDAKVTGNPNKGRVYTGIYEISGDTLKIYSGSEGKRPTELKTASGSGTILVVFKRVKK